MERISRERFIRLSTALGVGAAAASVAACGGGGSDSGSSGGGGAGGDAGSPTASAGGATTTSAPPEETTDSGGASGSGGAAIAQESEVAPGSAVAFKEGGKDAVLVHLDSGDFVAYSAICTHQGCTVKYRNNQLACPCHGSVFDPANGAAVVAGPAPTPLPEIPVEVRNGEVVRA